MLPEEQGRLLPEERVGPRRGEVVAAQIHAVTYLLVNGMLVAIWAAVGAGYFWPIWPIITWGPLLAFHAWFTYGRPRHSD